MANSLKQGTSLITLIMRNDSIRWNIYIYIASYERKGAYKEKGVIQIIEALHYCPKLIKLEFSYCFNQLIYQKLCHHFASYSHPVPKITDKFSQSDNSFYGKLYRMIFEKRKNQPESFSKYKYIYLVHERKVKDYELIFPLGEGAFGKTYLVRNGVGFK